jgi:ABC-type nitrate/sulfonate/bicarbonate transport system substrate-binding protein
MDHGRKSALVALLCAVALSVPDWSRAAEGAAGTKPFTMAVFQSELYLADYVAKEKGFDAKHGLEFKFVTPSNGAAAAQLMLAGNVQGWLTDPMIILTAASQGHAIKIAGLSAPTLAYSVLVSKDGKWPAENAPFAEKMAGLKGQTIGVSGIRAGTDNALILMLKAAGLSESDVNRVGIGQQQAAIGQLLGGRIDAFVSFSLAGNAVIERETGARLYMTTQDPDVPESVRAVPGATFAVSADFATKSPSDVTNWLAAEEAAVDWIKAHPDEAAVVLDKYVFGGKQIELAKAVLPKLISTYLASAPRNFKMSRKRYEGAIGAAKELGILTASQQLRYEELVIPSAHDRD